MARDLKTLDVSDDPGLLHLAEEVATTREPRVLASKERELALLLPIPSPAARSASRQERAGATRRAPTAQEIVRSRAGIAAAAGSWKDFDTEAFKTYIRERRRTSGRAPIAL
ncbi:MAG: hypothetical protein IT307_07390 [Chloroflexi bacterium]|nr:hypothetical protein [Chloroflexota bacterium]